MQPLMMTNAQDVYRKQGVMTASPMELILMLYDGLKKDLLQTQMAIKNNNMQIAHNKLMNAQDIVTELVNSLDLSYPISSELFSLYDYMLKSLEEINIKKDLELIPPLLEMVESLRDAWQQVGDMQKKKGIQPLNEE